jgi:hypothetical protein
LLHRYYYAYAIGLSITLLWVVANKGFKSRSEAKGG